jgi:hypothetical protein
MALKAAERNKWSPNKIRRDLSLHRGIHTVSIDLFVMNTALDIGRSSEECPQRKKRSIVQILY